MGMPRSLTIFDSISQMPGPPPQNSSARPPQNFILPSTLKAWRPYIGMKRMPLECIQCVVSRLLVTRISHSSGSVRYWVTRNMSSKNWSVV